jgi:adenosylhomocysteine nucleosidase
MAQVAWLNHLPFVIIRAISDKADHSAEVDYDEFEAKAIEHTVKLVRQMVKEMEA